MPDAPNGARAEAESSHKTGRRVRRSGPQGVRRPSGLPRSRAASRRERAMGVRRRATPRGSVTIGCTTSASAVSIHARNALDVTAVPATRHVPRAMSERSRRPFQRGRAALPTAAATRSSRLARAGASALLALGLSAGPAFQLALRRQARRSCWSMLIWVWPRTSRARGRAHHRGPDSTAAPCSAAACTSRGCRSARWCGLCCR